MSKPDAALSLFIPITKVDAAKRLVYGVATAEKPDVSKEVCDYASTKPYYEKWSADFAKVTDGKSVGNLRAMHGKVAAGKLTDISFNDADKQIEICAKVVDDAEWKKVEEGVYTGFSQGGAYVKRWKDADNPELTRYTANPIEVSLVDMPCLPEATFEVIKTDGASELRKFKTVQAAEPAPITNEAVAVRATKMAKDAGDEAKWPDHIAEARKAMEAEATAAAATPAAEAATAAVSGADEANKAAGPIEGAEQVWTHPDLAGQTFKKKADLREALTKAAADKTAKAAANPVLDKISAIGAELDKHDGTKPAEPATPTKLAAEKAALPELKDKDALKATIDGWDKLGFADKRHVCRAAVALEATDMLPEAVRPRPIGNDEIAKLGSGELKKGISLYGVANFLQLLAAIEGAEESCEYNDMWIGAINAPKELRDRFGAAVVELGDIAAQLLDLIVAAMRTEEATEAMEMARPIVDLMKAGARHSKADTQLLKSIHDHAVALGADCSAEKDAAGGDLAKVATELVQVKAERDALQKQMGEVVPKLDDMLERVKRIEAQPQQGGPVRKNVISRENDGGAPTVDTEDLEKLIAGMSDDDKRNLAFKLAMQSPRPLTLSPGK